MDAETQDAPEEVTEDAPQDSGPDLSEQMQDLGARFDKFLESQQQPEPQPDPIDILGAPAGDEREYEPEDEYVYEEEPQGDPRLDMVIEHLTAQEQARQKAELNSLADEYGKDFTDKVPEIRAKLDQMGVVDPALRGNAELVRSVYIRLKAEAEAAAETPAEEAASRGAGIERGASGSAPAEEDPDAAFIENFGKNRQASAFG